MSQTIVYIPGVWDLLHVGHLTVLENAKSLGDRLIVGIPSDEVVQEDKGNLPIIPLRERARLLRALSCVDLVAEYHELQFIRHLELFRPNVLAVGEHWGKEKRHKQAEQWAVENGTRLIKLPYLHGQSTTAIRRKIFHVWI